VAAGLLFILALNHSMHLQIQFNNEGFIGKTRLLEKSIARF